jgi:hypothetical protein
VLTGATWKRCAAVPLQVYCTSWTLSAVEADGTSRHLPLCRLTKWYAPPPSSMACHCWLLPPPYVHRCTAALSAEELLLTSTTCWASLRLLIRTKPSLVGVKLHC